MSHKLTVFRGTSYAFRVFYERAVDGAAPTPASLVGATIRFTVKPLEWDADDDDSSATLAINVTSHVDAAGGESVVQFDPTDTADLTPGEYHWDVRVEHAPVGPADPVIYVLDSGIFNLEGRPTNRVAP